MATGLFDLSGRLSLVTGSSRGLGLAIAQGLAESGAELVLNGRDAAALEQARSLEGPTDRPSIFAALAAGDVPVRPQRMRKRTLVALSCHSGTCDGSVTYAKTSSGRRSISMLSVIGAISPPSDPVGGMIPYLPIV